MATNISTAMISDKIIRAAHDMTAEQLKARLEALPIELYDNIQDLVFKFEGSETLQRKCPNIFAAQTSTDEVIRINAQYKPPIQMQMNAASRAKFSKWYYKSDRAFLFEDVWILENWLKSVPARSLIGARLICVRQYDQFPQRPQLSSYDGLPAMEEARAMRLEHKKIAEIRGWYRENVLGEMMQLWWGSWGHLNFVRSEGKVRCFPFLIGKTFTH